MKHVTLITLGVVLTGALMAPAALGKGASEATITGPGIKPVALAGSGEYGGGGQLAEIAAAAGFFPAVFGGPDPQELFHERPEGRLGPRYTITYTMPGSNNEEDTLVQEVYPYAQPEAVTYTEPGQRFWSTEQTRGGWYLSSWYLAGSLKELLVGAGLPTSAPTAVGDGHGRSSAFVATLLVAAVASVVGALTARRIRRRFDIASAS